MKAYRLGLPCSECGARPGQRCSKTRKVGKRRSARVEVDRFCKARIGAIPIGVITNQQ